MFSRSFFPFLLFTIALPTASGYTDPQAPPEVNPQVIQNADQPQSRQVSGKETEYDRMRAELEGKLKVTQVLLKGTGEKGVEIEISYRIVDVDGYAAHPKTTFIADEASARLVPMTKLHKLFTPLPAAEAEKQPPATLTIWDEEGVIKPGQPVTVVVAGYGQKHIIPVAGPGYDPDAVEAASIPAKSHLAAPDARLTVHEVKVVAQGHLLNVRFSSSGIKALDPAENLTYVKNPATGKRHPVARVPRIGLLAPKDLEGLVGSYMVIDNAGAQIKPGQRVDVVVSGVRAENVLVMEE